MKSYYYLLKDEEKIIYKEILNALLEHRKRVKVSKVDIRRLREIFDFILLDYPQIFYVIEDSISLSSLGRIQVVNISYKYDLETVIGINEKIEIEIEKILEKAKNIEDNFSKEIIIYRYIVENIQYNNDRKIASDYSIEGVLLSKKAVCLGIAKTFKLLMDRLFIPTIVVLGDIKDENGITEAHAWNIISLESNLYHLDATGDLGKDFRFGYFNLSSHDIRDRTLRYDYPICNSIKHNYFNYKGAYIQNIEHLESFIKTRLKKGDKIIEFRTAFNLSIEELNRLLSRLSLLRFILMYEIQYTSENIFRVRVKSLADNFI